MTPFNLRSLLLAAIFLSNCISWTASRHHYTHNVNGHRSRHRRQGAGLFLSGSYILPGGEGSGWGEWGDISPCSRTCGGGVASQKRICLQIGPDGQPLCPGGDTKFFSCQTQDCPAGSKDFRAEQCSEFDDQLFWGTKYQWVPYMNAPNPCELNCMPHAERFYYRHKAKVIDGTPCPDSFDICVNGTCQPLGCDMMLGSSAKEDKCRVCRGNNANCHTTTGLLDAVDLTRGYVDMLLIPEGSTNIVIEEVKPSRNYLALHAKNGTFYLNGNNHIDFPRDLPIAGAMWTYERNEFGFEAPDKLRTLGPINEPVFLSLYLMDENVGVEYEYSLPSDMAPPQNEGYNWVWEEFTPCSASCGGGFQTRNVSCRTREKLEIVDEKLCDEGLRPATNQICNIQACDPQWVPGAWGKCSKSCGMGGTSSREVTCQKVISNGYPSIVAESECFDLLGPKPNLFQKCNENATCPTWFTGPWKPCNKRCDEGQQSRQVVCYQKTGRKIEVLEDEACEETRPEEFQACMVQPCDGVDWVASEWNGCDSCQSTIRTRTVVCATKTHVVVEDRFCSYHHNISTQEDCSAVALPPCQFQWYATQWSNCSAVCGKGLQSRSVFCGQFDGSSVKKVDDSNCSNQPKYNDSKPCEVPKEQCPMQWFTAPWSACSMACGDGLRTRKVMCLQGEKMAAGCPSPAPEPKEDCNLGPCGKVTTEPPEELDECLDEDSFPEVGLDSDAGLMMYSDSTASDEFISIEGSGSTWPDTTFVDGWSTNTETEETGSGSTTETLTDDTESGPMDGSTETTESDSTETTESGPTESTETTESGPTETTETTESGPTESTETTESGPTETTETTESGPTESTETTESGPTETTETTESGPTESTKTTESGPTETTETTESGPTETTETTESGPTESTETTESGPTESTETTESGPTETTETTESGPTESTETTESGPTESTETTESGPTETTETTESGPTESTETTESGPTESTETTETGPTETTETTESGPTESTETTESGPTESTETTESGPTETTETTESGPTESTETTESGSTESTETTESGPTETTETTESGPTESTETTESGPTETTETTESGPTESTETTESGPTETTETTESGPTESTETTESGPTESTETTESGPTETTETTESGPTESTETTESGPTETTETTESGPTESTETTESGPTETTETTESGPTESTETTESGPTETTETTESGPTESTETTESGPTETTETTESGPTESTETTESGPTETTETTESGPTESTETTESGPTESTETTESGPTESTETTESGPTETTETTESGPTETTETTESGPTETTDSESTFESTESSTTDSDGFTSSVVEWFTSKTPRMCKPRQSCNSTEFGCCPDMKKSAQGPFDEGCDKPVVSCKQTEFGCCPDGVSPAPTADFKGCPEPDCNETLFGCCLSDNKTAAEGNDQDGCPPPPPPCESSKFGCCKDGETEATGPAKEGCPETTVPETEPPTSTMFTSTMFTSTTTGYEGCENSQFGCCYDNATEASGPDQQGCPCDTTEFGCCPDGVSPAKSLDVEGCMKSCNSSAYGCCPDAKTPAHGPNQEGCCLLSAFGCCRDNYNFAHGPNFEGCECQNSPYGCCPDNVTSASGYDNKGCGCSYSPHGCCPDAHTEASGPEFQGCGCHTYQFGCCPDGVTIARGPEGQGCDCRQSKFKCCGDGVTHATGPNREGCDCSSSKFGCCLDGQTEATGPKFQGCTEAPENKQAACGLAFARGPCRNYSVYWYFDTEYGGCSRFWYGGCEGNGNRFATKEECDDVCVSPPPKEACKLPQSKGACLTYSMHWYYDTARESCANFAYGGCLGNNNNFETRELCEKQCQPEKATELCSLPIEQGSCSGNFSRWGFNQESRACEQFVWGGCEGNTNRFNTEAACNLRCNPPGQPKPECSQPQDKGTCEDTEAVWSFSQSADQCVPFYYSGCGGNGNIFTSQEDCEISCPRVYVPDKCTIPYDTGDCANYSEKWYFDTKGQRCRPFYYGGCGGNENHFESEQLCQNECQPTPSTTTVAPTASTAPTAPAQQPRPQPTNREDFCFYELDAGPCTDFKTSWGYDYKTGRCTTFQYGGCGGNRNNFPDELYCQYYCRATQDICQQPMLQGPCDGSQMRWFYDKSSDSCSQFTYGGCEGNDNRFESRSECENRCKSGPVEEQTTVTTTVVTRPEKVIQQNCLISSTLEACSPEQAGEYWYLNVANRECVPHENPAEGDSCRTTGVFSSQEGCERSCGSFRGIDVCMYPPEAGVCNKFVSKYFFNGTSGQCEEFAYGGCTGGPNRFSTQQECVDVCKPVVDPCKQMPEPGNCLSRYEMWFYSQGEDRCRQFIYGGCGGNENRFETQEACEGHCKQQPGEVVITTTTTPAPIQPLEPECVTPASLEPCGANETVFYYDSAISTCRAAELGRCDQPNRYRTEEECERRCGAFRGLDVCRTQVDPGPCSEAIAKYYFDVATGVCQEFAYGGCQGGPNRFSTIQECQENCREAGPAPACLQEVAIGESCGALPSRRWYYSAARAGCLVFAYLGCGGNENNFLSYDECATICKVFAIDTEAVLCDTYRDECEALESSCEYGVKITVVDGGCRRCSCVERCDRQQQECDALRCSYGVEKTPGDDGCESCKCQEDPCSTANCSSNEKCVASAYRDPTTQTVQYSAYCAPDPPAAPQASPDTEPEQSATRGGNATLRCIFHANPPPHVSWKFGEITIDSDRGRYRLLADGALEIVALERDDSGTYVCVAYNPLGTAQQEIRLVVSETSPCDIYNEECVSLQSTCKYGIKAVVADEVCQRCLCAEKTNCEQQNQECDALICPYGVKKTSESNGCESCKCAEDPCSTANCSANERCVASAYRDPATQAVKYSAHCVPDTDTNEVLPECEQYVEHCAKLFCPYSVQKTVTSRGCVKCSCVQVEVDCEPLQQECDNLKCNYGIGRSRGEDGCERCNCLQHPCINQLCADTERCVLAPYRDPVSFENSYVADCRSVNKTGVCPADNSRSTESACRSECRDDADCRGVGKCCTRGCSKLCLSPADPTPPPTMLTTTLAPMTQHVTTYRPDMPRAPQASTETVPEMTASEGGKAVLRCIFHSNPPPQITWKFGEITIDGDSGRYRLQADGALEIVALVRDDSGVYVCVASNQFGTAQQEIRLVVSDPVPGPAYIAGDAGVVVGELGSPLQIHCRAYGYPEPAIYWYRGLNGPMVPYSNTLYEARDQVLTIKSLMADTLGEYACYAYNGHGKPATWVVTVQGYQPDDNAIGPYYVPRDQVVAVTPPERTTHTTTTSTTILPDIQPPSYIDMPRAPQASAETEPELTAPEGGKAVLRCIFHSNPPPQITWKFGEIMINGDSGRYRLQADGALEIVALVRDDSGVYVCVAYNQFGTAQQEVRLVVNDPVPGPAYIAGDAGVMVGELGSPLQVHCRAYGYPEPAIYWYRGLNGPMVPYSNTLYEARDQVLTIRSLTADTLGEYACYAYNGHGKPATWVVTVQGYQPDDNAIGPYYVPRDQVVAVTPPERATHTTTTSTTILPDIQAPPAYIVPVSTELLPASTTISAGTELSLPCNVDGYPEPRVTWTKDGVNLAPTDTMWVTGTRLTIPRTTISDSGVYGCHASNQYSSHSSTVQITVKEIVIPSKCTDSAYFANCALIVQGKFCRHKYYSKFCCKSCVEAGQLDPNTIDMQSDEPYRKK